jgi:hypothetical protein
MSNVEDYPQRSDGDKWWNVCRTAGTLEPIQTTAHYFCREDSGTLATSPCNRCHQR